MIDGALVLLARLRFGGWLRRLRPGRSSPRRLVLFIIGAGIMALWLFSAVIGTAVRHDHPDPQHIRQVAPLWMFAITLMMAFLSGGGKIITFSAADIDFLFPGPFSRHQLVLYKIGITAFAALWASLFFSIWLGRHASLWIAGYVGIWLTWMFAQSLAILILLARKELTGRRSSLLARAGMGALLVLVLAAVVEIVRPLLAGDWSWEAALAGSQSLPGRIVLAPFRVLTAAFTAERIFPDLLQWAALSLAMIVAQIGPILLLDRHFIETALGASESLQARLKRARRGGGAFAAARPIARFRIGMLPRMGGVGTLAWRQLLTVVRGARGLLGVMIVLIASVGPLLWFTLQRNAGNRIEVLAPVLGIGGMWLLFVLPSMLRFDFRGDLPHIETLKLLPLPPPVVAIGQMLAPVLVMTLLVWLLAAIVCATAPDLLAACGIAAALSPPVLLLVVGIENAMFLLFPAQLAMATPGDMSLIGRTMVVFIVKMLTMSVTLGLAAGAGAIGYFLSRSWAIAFVAAWIVLLGLAAATVPVVAQLFIRFDPSADKPPE